MKHIPSLLLLSSSISLTAASQACSLRGRQYPPSVQISSEAKFQAAGKKIDSFLAATANKAPYTNISFSVGVFSTDEEELLYQYHHTSPGVKSSSQGTHEIDADSVYRIGSISKLLTVFMWLVQDGDGKFNDPISLHIPALKQYSAGVDGLTPDWDSITVGDLAGQMSGLVRDYGLGDLAPPKSAIVVLPPEVKKAFPKIPESEVPTCSYALADGSLEGCTADEYIKGVASETPIFESAYTPVYSNEAFALLGLALQNITGVPLAVMFNSTYSDDIGLSSTYFSTPSDSSNAIIPGDPTTVGWDTLFGPFATAGGFYSTTNDMASLGRSILSSALLPKSTTNRWLKPSSFVENFSQGVGRPFEIFRRKINGQSVELYTKGGDWGVYHTLFILVPQWDVGFTIFTARDVGPEAGVDSLVFSIPNQIVDSILPVIEEIAKDQATEKFAGTYSDSATNSSLTISTAANTTGLLVKGWTSNGVDLLAVLQTQVPGLVFRIMPSMLTAGSQVSFTGFYESPLPPLPEDIWYWRCPGWVNVDGLTYGNVPLGSMVFEVDGEGKATSVGLRALRVSLTRSG